MGSRKDMKTVTETRGGPTAGDMVSEGIKLSGNDGKDA